MLAFIAFMIDIALFAYLGHQTKKLAGLNSNTSAGTGEFLDLFGKRARLTILAAFWLTLATVTSLISWSISAFCALPKERGYNASTRFDAKNNRPFYQRIFRRRR